MKQLFSIFRLLARTDNNTLALLVALSSMVALGIGMVVILRLVS